MTEQLLIKAAVAFAMLCATVVAWKCMKHESATCWSVRVMAATAGALGGLLFAAAFVGLVAVGAIGLQILFS